MLSAPQGASVFVVPDYKNSEMWICFQSGGATEKGSAIKPSFGTGQRNHWTIRDLPNVICGTVVL